MSLSGSEELMAQLEMEYQIEQKWLNSTIPVLYAKYEELKAIRHKNPSLEVSREQWHDFITALSTLIPDKKYTMHSFSIHAEQLLNDTEAFLRTMKPLHFSGAREQAAKKVIHTASEIAYHITGESIEENYRIISVNMILALCNLQFYDDYRKRIIVPFINDCSAYVKHSDSEQDTYIKLFDRYFEKAIKLIQQSSFYTDELDTELAALLYIVFDLAFMRSLKDRATLSSAISNHFLSKNPLPAANFNDRIDFYSSFIRGKRARGECIGFQIPLPEFIIAFGDIMCNPACLDDYDNAPIYLRDIFDLADFVKSTLVPLTDIVIALTKKIEEV